MDNSKIGHHISEQFNKELEDIRNKVLTMGGLVERQIEHAVEAYTTGNMELAEQVIKQDNQVDAMEMAIDLECTQIMALRQPTAFDLRLLITVLRVIHEIERVGDKAERIAEMAIQLAGGDSRFPHYELEHMAVQVKKMLHDALDVFARINIEKMSAVFEQEDKVDREYDNILRQLITRTLDVLWTVRALERIGDHACYICEHLIFMIKGEDVRHLSQPKLVKKVNAPR